MSGCVGDRLHHDAERGHLGLRGQSAQVAGGLHGHGKAGVVGPAIQEGRALLDGGEQAELVEDRRAEVVDEPADVRDATLHLADQPVEDLLGSRGILPDEAADDVELERHPGKRRPQAVVKVAPYPATLLLACQHEALDRLGQARRPADGQCHGEGRPDKGQHDQDLACRRGAVTASSAEAPQRRSHHRGDAGDEEPLELAALVGSGPSSPDEQCDDADGRVRHGQQPAGTAKWTQDRLAADAGGVHDEGVLAVQWSGSECMEQRQDQEVDARPDGDDPPTRRRQHTVGVEHQSEGDAKARACPPAPGPCPRHPSHGGKRSGIGQYSVRPVLAGQRRPGEHRPRHQKDPAHQVVRAAEDHRRADCGQARVRNCCRHLERVPEPGGGGRAPVVRHQQQVPAGHEHAQPQAGPGEGPPPLCTRIGWLGSSRR